MKITLILALVVVTLVGIVVGSTDIVNNYNRSHGFGNAGHSVIDNTPAQVYQMPKGYDNVAEKCDKRGNLLITTANADTTSFVQVVPGGCK